MTEIFRSVRVLYQGESWKEWQWILYNLCKIKVNIFVLISKMFCIGLIFFEFLTISVTEWDSDQYQRKKLQMMTIKNAKNCQYKYGSGQPSPDSTKLDWSDHKLLSGCHIKTKRWLTPIKQGIIWRAGTFSYEIFYLWASNAGKELKLEHLLMANFKFFAWWLFLERLWG